MRGHRVGAIAVVGAIGCAGAGPTPGPIPSPIPSPSPSPFAGAPLPTTKLSDTVAGAGCLLPQAAICSVLIGIPEGWNASSVYGAYDLAEPAGSDRAGHPLAVGYYHAALGTAAGGAAGDFAASNLQPIAFVGFLRGATWSAPVDVEVGEAPRAVEGQGRLVRGLRRAPLRPRTWPRGRGGGACPGEARSRPLVW